MDNQKKIIADCVKGDNKARETIYKLFSGTLYGTCLRYTKSAEDAKDVLQESFVKIFQKIGQYKELGSFEGWMRRVVINCALEKYRHMYYVKEHDNAYEYSENLADETVYDSFSVNELLDMVQQLPTKYRMVFNMYAIEGYSHKEISNLLKISEGTSKSNLSRARAILQNKLMKIEVLTKKKVTA